MQNLKCKINLRITNNSERITRNGFTLIELLIAIAIVSIMSTVGIAAFINYQKVQTLSSAALDISTTLRADRSRSIAAIKPADGSCDGTIANPHTLTGYLFTVSPAQNTYKTDIVCDGNVMHSEVVKKLPTTLTFSPSQNQVSFLFQVLTGQVTITGGNSDGTGTITVCQSQCLNGSKSITISQNATITSQ